MIGLSEESFSRERGSSVAAKGWKGFSRRKRKEGRRKLDEMAKGYSVVVVVVVVVHFERQEER